MSIVKLIKERMVAAKEGFKLGYKKAMIQQTVNSANTLLGIQMQAVIEQGIGGAYYDLDNKRVLIDIDVIGIMKQNKYDLKAIRHTLNSNGINKFDTRTVLMFLYLHEVGHSFTATKSLFLEEQEQRDQLTHAYYKAISEEDIFSIAMAYRRIPLEKMADDWAINKMKELKLS